nr:hypothetical protein [Tanacetum cinerariifolium]
ADPRATRAEPHPVWWLWARAGRLLGAEAPPVEAAHGKPGG